MVLTHLILMLFFYSEKMTWILWAKKIYDNYSQVSYRDVVPNMAALINKDQRDQKALKWRAAWDLKFTYFMVP